jgi:hypothetical protein
MSHKQNIRVVFSDGDAVILIKSHSPKRPLVY